MKNKKILIIFVIAILLCLLGTTYAFFNYYKIGSNQEIIAGKVALEFVEDVDTISLTNVFPETTEEARQRDDNFVTFTISGTNTTTNKDVFYQIMLNEGADEDGKKRFKPNELVFDLVEIDENNNETYLVDAMYFNDLNAQRIWVDIVEREETTGINKTYKLRMWINDNVLVSDSYPNADYTTDEFANGYASVKVTVQGDFKEKASPYNYMKRSGGTIDINNVAGQFWPDEIHESIGTITEVRFMSMEKEMLDMLASEGAFDLTDTTKSPAGSVIAMLMDTQLWIMSDGITIFPEDCSGMFFGCTSLTQVYFNNISTRYSTNMHAMFCGVTTTLNLNSFDTRNVTNMSSMFFASWNLANIIVGNLDTGNVTNMSQMFYSCGSLTSLDVSRWDTSQVTDMSSMFYNCQNLASLDVGNWDTSSVTDMSVMFQFCWALTNLDVRNWDTTSVSNMSDMFYQCKTLTSLEIGAWDTSGVSNMSSMFAGCSGLASLDVSAWDTSSSTDISGMFSSCSKLTRLNLSGWVTSNVTDMSGMFNGCSGLIELDFSNFDTSKVTDMGHMFYDCENLEKLNLETFDTSGVTDMSHMFSFCEGLISLDLTNFNTSNVTDMSWMFSGCSNLTSLDISNFTFDGVTSYDEIFNGMKDRVGNTPTIIVKDATAQNWILALTSFNRPSSWTTENVIIG